jgi:hypothetical protein
MLGQTKPLPYSFMPDFVAPDNTMASGGPWSCSRANTGPRTAPVGA